MKLFDEAKCGGRVSILSKTRIEAFSRTDLSVVVFIVLLLGVWFVRGHTGEHARIAQCEKIISKFLGRPCMTTRAITTTNFWRGN